VKSSNHPDQLKPNGLSYSDYTGLHSPVFFVNAKKTFLLFFQFYIYLYLYFYIYLFINIMALQTQLEHIASEKELRELLDENENLMVCCGRMGPMCVPVYRAMETLKEDYPHVKFMDMEFDLPDAQIIRELSETRGFMGLPFTVYYKNGEVVAATTSIQTKEDIREILERKFENQ